MSALQNLVRRASCSYTRLFQDFLEIMKQMRFETNCTSDLDQVVTTRTWMVLCSIHSIGELIKVVYVNRKHALTRWALWTGEVSYS